MIWASQVVNEGTGPTAASWSAAAHCSGKRPRSSSSLPVVGRRPLTALPDPVRVAPPPDGTGLAGCAGYRQDVDVLAAGEFASPMGFGHHAWARMSRLMGHAMWQLWFPETSPRRPRGIGRAVTGVEHPCLACH